MTEQELPSINIVLDEVRRRLDFQFEQLDGLNTKSGIVLGVAGVIFTLLVTNLLDKSSTVDNLILAKIALVPIFASLVISFVPIYIINWDRPPNVERLRSHYIVEDFENTQLNIIDKCLEAIENNEKLLKKLVRLIKCSYFLLLIGLALYAYRVNSHLACFRPFLLYNSYLLQVVVLLCYPPTWYNVAWGDSSMVEQSR